MFNEKVPGHFFQLKGDLAEILEQYHRRAIALVERRSVTKESKDMLDKALSICCKSMGEQLGSLEQSMISKQKEINRMFAETIRTKLMPTYEECAEQKGESLQFLSHKGVINGKKSSLSLFLSPTMHRILSSDLIPQVLAPSPV